MPEVSPVKPVCWCCTCVNADEAAEGCRACHTSDPVQKWIDTHATARGDNPSDLRDHRKRGFLCPSVAAPQCPGYKPKGEPVSMCRCRSPFKEEREELLRELDRLEREHAQRVGAIRQSLKNIECREHETVRTKA